MFQFFVALKDCFTQLTSPLFCLITFLGVYKSIIRLLKPRSGTPQVKNDTEPSLQRKTSSHIVLYNSLCVSYMNESMIVTSLPFLIA